MTEKILNEDLNEELDKETNNEEKTEETCEVQKEMIEKEKYDELYDKYLRVLAEYDNYKKRSQKEKEDMFGYAVCDTVEKLLPVIDNLDRAVLSLDENDKSEFAEGVKMVLKQFYDILEKIGVTEIETLNCQFDPNIHNAVMHTDDEQYDVNVVIEQFVKGYKYKEKVIRHSMVKVAN